EAGRPKRGTQQRTVLAGSDRDRRTAGEAPPTTVPDALTYRAPHRQFHAVIGAQGPVHGRTRRMRAPVRWRPPPTRPPRHAARRARGDRSARTAWPAATAAALGAAARSAHGSGTPARRAAGTPRRRAGGSRVAAGSAR